MKLKKMIDAFKELNAVNIINAIYPYGNSFELVHSCFIADGIADYPTILILVKDFGIREGHILFTINGHSGYTTSKFISSNITAEEFIINLNEKNQAADRFPLCYYLTSIGEPYFMTINESKRLYNYLKANGIKLFEPKK